MPTPEIRWIRTEVSAPRGSRLRSMASPAVAAMDAAKIPFERPDLTLYPTPIEKARLLLHTAAEVEHALLVQYLYAGYSLKSPADPELTSEQQQAVAAWRESLVGIAIEEMGHLMTVQNLLLFTRQPLNFEREDFPPRKQLYPFAMHLEPLTQLSLAKYVVAEAPVRATRIDDIIAQATGAVGMTVQRVAVLYGLLGVVFSTPSGIEKNAAGGDGWYQMVRELAQCVYQDQPPERWHLLSKAFDKSSIVRQAVDDVWGRGSTSPHGQALRVFRVTSRHECLEALRDIGLQGEGPTIDTADSHFARFHALYRGDASQARPAFPDNTGWTPTHSVPIDPRVVTGESTNSNDIVAPTAVAWATLADARYALLLGLLEQYFHTDPSDRDWIRDACFAAMRHLRQLADELTAVDRSATPGLRAALPFQLSAPLHLPETAEERRQLHLARLQSSIEAAKRVLAIEPQKLLPAAIKSSDEALLPRFGGGPIVEPPQDPAAAMRALLEEKQSDAQFLHGAIAVGAGTLRQLFVDQNYDAILDFLRTGVSVRPPFAGKKLIEPGKPLESGFYLQIKEPNGVMSGVFDAQDIQVVENWIHSLPAVPPTQPDPPPAEPDPRVEMIAVLRARRGIARFMHNAIAAGNGTLSDLFEAEDYDAILEFLQTAKATVPPFAGLPVIVPQRAGESAFYLHITDPAGAMVGKLTPDEVLVVERWIRSLPPLPAPPPTTPDNLKVSARLVTSGLFRPLFVTAPPGDHRRLFVVEQTGRIRILDLASGQLTPQPFLQVTGLSSGSERGLLGLAFHPEYAANGLLYVHCTNTRGHTEIRRYQVSGSDPDTADPATALVILHIEQPFANHNGGWLAFGPRDGMLYIGMGDGGSGNDPQNNSQNLGTLLGKMLRIDVDAGAPGDGQRYGVPASNPFVGHAGARPEIWAYGLRNPWRASFDRATHDLYIGDVGQSEREEIDLQPAASTGGENYGWRLKEGTLETGLDPVGGTTVVDPIHEYGRSDGIAVIGGYVYRGIASPAMVGTYFFADFNGRLWSLSGADHTRTERTAELAGSGARLNSISSFGEDAAGELYFTTLEGNVYQLQGSAVPVDADRWRDVARVRIHPAIGVARVGNAGFAAGHPSTPAEPADYFIGPERPFDVGVPQGGYKRQGRVRRQAARFRLFAYDAADQLIGEVTAHDADITWTVELANKKASFRQFAGANPNASPRNPHVTGAQRQKLDITPGPRTLTGPNQAAAFDTGSFTDWRNGQSQTDSNIYLGGIQTEETGRLLVLAGEGRAGAPWNKPITHFANNNGWCDTMADGPVNATVRFRESNQSFQALGAWVIGAPPKFAPAIRNIITLYDTLRQVAIDKGLLPAPGQPSFTRDIYPILVRAMEVKWLLSAPGAIHDSIVAAFPPASQSARNQVLRRLRNPNKGQGLNGPGMNMPLLFDDENDWSPSGDQGLAITKTMHAMLTQWRDGQFLNDWTGTPPEPPADITPAGLDQAALENCAGAAFFPGIEASWLLRDAYDYLEPFRLNQADLRAGDITKQMAVPWQADFLKCTSGGSTIAWWPQQRPDEVFTATGNRQVDWIREKVRSHQDMVNRWHELGFVVWNGTRYVETDRNPDSPGPIA